MERCANEFVRSQNRSIVPNYYVNFPSSIDPRGERRRAKKKKEKRERDVDAEFSADRAHSIRRKFDGGQEEISLVGCKLKWQGARAQKESEPAGAASKEKATKE